ncbi:MAG: hypothetical protein P8Q36_14585 [Alphaproteobacteria bacterium]|jgi:23S rRNA (uracil1939-C5)-methyltransferase|nr:class I SAM-dependent RNA methyltransferase [Rhodospirillaceae bacterium]MDG2482072.1 hypothetical protein [Alphaproteobacteria bacterium]MBT6203463.1 class I SAM-dependent RNA methyltransferase [Rhodospirillaceae bacterium]MBT6512397.1 class I SAM-dependent RNA methyltransferase [Rhodospirillaceae bacterium]MBT7614875.1 class I SAM-dependent RNA methyltransferase [Rhodospirillaceae bacterium]
MARRSRQQLTALVDRLGSRGDGIVAHNSGSLFVAGALPGETVVVEPGRKRGDGKEAALISLETSSSDRQQPHCPHFDRCGGCVMQHAAPDLYATWKRSLLIDALARRGFAADVVQPMESAPPGSRRRLRFAVTRRDQSYVPAFRTAHSQNPIAISTCPVANSRLLEAATAACKVLGSRDTTEMEVTLTDTGINLLVAARSDPDMVLSERFLAFAETFDLARIVWRSTGRPPYVVAERRMPAIRSGSFTINLPPGAFVQPTAWGEDRIRERLAPLVAGAEHVADLFSGCGVLGLSLLPGPRVEMFEADPAMVQAARLASGNQGPGDTATVRDLEDEPLAGEELKRFDTIILDPPRSGARAQCEKLAASSVRAIAYVSCHPGTFTRDARILADGGYHLAAVWPIDQFLWSHHLELVAHFVRR